MFYSQLAPRVTRTRSVQAVVYLERHVVSFEYFVSLYDCNNRLYIKLFAVQEYDLKINAILNITATLQYLLSERARLTI